MYEVVNIAPPTTDHVAAKAAINRTASPLRCLETAGSITSAGREAGEAFDATYRFVWAGTRSDILAQTVRGYGHESAAEAERMVRAKDLLAQVERGVSRAAYVVGLAVCVEEVYLGRERGRAKAYADLRAFLARCRDAFGIPEAKDGASDV